NAEISNDTTRFKALMLVGNSSQNLGKPNSRLVQVWDNLEVNSNLKVGGAAAVGSNLAVNGNAKVENTLWVKGTLSYYWGPDGQWKHIENRAGNMAGSFNNNGPTFSDLRLKRAVQAVPSALDKIRHLRGVTFRWNDEALRHFTRDIETTISAGPDASE